MSMGLPEASWVKSSYSNSTGECVEVAWLRGGGVGVRDSKSPDGPALMFAPEEWDAFAAELHNGGYDQLA